MKQDAYAHSAETIYDGDVISVTLSVNKPSKVTDSRLFAHLLIAAGIDSTLVEKALKQATKERRGSHIISYDLRVD